MAVIKTIFKGESLSMLFTFPVAYDMARIEKHEVYIGETAFTGTVSGKTIALKLKSDDTGAMLGQYKVSLWIDDTILGLWKPHIGDIVSSSTNATTNNDSTSEVFSIIIPVVVSETAVTVGDILYNILKGDKGDTFEYSDFTPAQIAELQQPAADAIASVEAVELSVEQAEALRVQAEIDRQTNTGTAIQNAETATGLANTATGLANDAAALATEVANNPDKVVADYWWKWNTTSNAYENTGIKAKGEPGATALVKQVTGTSETDVMSQKIVSPIIDDYNKLNHNLFSESEFGTIVANGVEYDYNTRLRSKLPILLRQTQYALKNIKIGYNLNGVHAYLNGVWVKQISVTIATGGFFVPDGTYNQVRLVFQKLDNSAITQAEIDSFTYTLEAVSSERLILIEKGISDINEKLDSEFPDNYPFEKLLPYPKGSKYDAIIGLSVTDNTLDMSKGYYIQYCGFNALREDNTYRHYFGISREDQSGQLSFVAVIGKNVGVSYINTVAEFSGIVRLVLYRPNTEVEIGYVDIDISKAYSPNYFNGTYLNSKLRKDVFKYNLNANAIVATKDTHRLLIPESIYFLNDNKLPVYMRSIISNEYAHDSMKLYVGKIDTDFPFMKRVSENVELTPSDFSTTARIAAKYGSTYAIESVGYYKDLVISKATTAGIIGKTASVIISGDSITDYDITGFVGQKLTTLGASISHVGTMNDGLPYYNEGRMGWEYRNFFGKMTKWGSNTGGAVVPQPTGATSDVYKNPFIRIATPAEIAANPEWCFENNAVAGGAGLVNEKNYTESQTSGGYTGDYYTVSIIDYIVNHGINIGDKLIWISNWGFNDLNHWGGSESAILDAFMGMEILATKLKDYAVANPTKQVILGISPLLIVQLYNNWDAFSSYLERAIKKVKALNTTLASANFKVEIVPVWMSVDRSWSWEYAGTSTDLNSNNDTKYKVPSDMLHPGTFGKNQISNVIVNYLANKIK